MSFFGFDAVLPERRNDGAAEEDIAVYTWGTEAYDDLGAQLIEGGDEANDETFGDMPISESSGGGVVDACSADWHGWATIADDFQFAHHAPGQTLGSTSVGKSTTAKKSKRATGADLFASTEADFFGFSKKSELRARRNRRVVLTRSGN